VLGDRGQKHSPLTCIEKLKSLRVASHLGEQAVAGSHFRQMYV
jgi:hypothetical protein